MHIQLHEICQPHANLRTNEVDVGIRTGVYKAAVVSAWRERPNFIIGAKFLATNSCELSLHQKLFTIGEYEMQCIPEGVTLTALS